MENFSRVQTTSVGTSNARNNLAKNDTKSTCNGTDHARHVCSASYLPLPLPPSRLPLPSGNTKMELKRPGLKHRSKASSRSKSWFESGDMGRRKRITMYKLYAAEGKIKRSFKKGIKWLKHTCSKIAQEFSWSLDCCMSLQVLHACMRVVSWFLFVPFHKYYTFSPQVF